MLRRRFASHPVQAAAHPLDKPLAHELEEPVVRDAQGRELTRAEERPDAGAVEACEVLLGVRAHS